MAGGPHRSRTDIHTIHKLPGAGAVISGMRTDCDIALVISPQAAAEAGCIFYRSSNEVYLTEGLEGTLPPKFIRAVIIMETREMITSESTATAPTWDAVCEGLLRAEQLYMTVRCSGHVLSNHDTDKPLYPCLVLQEQTRELQRPAIRAVQRQRVHLPICQARRRLKKSGQSGNPARHQVIQQTQQTQYARLGKPTSALPRTKAWLKYPKTLLTFSREPKPAATGTQRARHPRGAVFRLTTVTGKCQLTTAETTTKADVAPNQGSVHGSKSNTQRAVHTLTSAGKHNCSELSPRSRQSMCNLTTFSCPARSKKAVEVRSIRPLTDMKKPAANTSRTALTNCFNKAIAMQPGHRRSRRSRQWTPLEAHHRTSNRRFKEGARGKSTWTKQVQQTRQTGNMTRKTYKPAGNKIRRSQRHQAPLRGAIPPMRHAHQLPSLIARAAQPLLTRTESQQDHRRQWGRHSSNMPPISLGPRMLQHRQGGRHHPQHADRSQQLDQNKPVTDTKARSLTLSKSSRGLTTKYAEKRFIAAGMGQPSNGAQKEEEADDDMSARDLCRQLVVKQCINSAHCAAYAD